MEIILLYISLAILTIYAWVGLLVFLGFYMLPIKKSINTEIDFISILIPFRNEEEHLQDLIKSLRLLEYPKDKFEIIFINDHSSDKGLEIIEQSGLDNFRILNCIGEGKKAAISLGVEQAKGPLIVTTDADCMVPKNWLEEINNAGLYSMILGAVQLYPTKNALHIFQELEWAALQSISGSSAFWKMPMMNNGANLSYQKAEFKAAALKKETASGDDIFLLEDFTKRKLSVRFLWDTRSLVKTQPVNSVKELLQQKVRWASKSKHYKNKLNTFLGILIALVNIFVIYHLVNMFTESATSYMAIPFLVTKLIIDAIIVLPYLILVKKPYLVFFLPIFVWVYPFYFIYVLILSLRGKFTWKERNYHA